MISIIIATFNEDKWLKRTVDSIIGSNQGTRTDYEIVIVDDGSTDGSTKFLTNHNEKYSKVTLLRSEEGLGVAKARNLGAEAAQGEILMFVDAHMIFSEKLLNKIEDRLKNSPQISVLGIHCLDQSLYSDLPNLTNISIYTNSDRTFCNPRWILLKRKSKSIFRVPFVNAANLIVRRNVFEKVHGFADYIEGWGPEDRTFSLTAYLFGFDCYFDPNLWIWHYYKNQQTLSKEVNEKKSDIWFNILSACYCLYDQPGFDLALKEVRKIFPSIDSSSYYKNFIQKKSKLDKYKHFIDSQSTRTIEQFENEFSRYLPYLADEKLSSSFEYSKKDPDKALAILSDVLSDQVRSSSNENKKYLPYIYFRLAFINGDMKKAKFSVQKKYLEKSLRQDYFFIPAYSLYARYLYDQMEYKQALTLLFSAKEIINHKFYQKGNFYTDPYSDAYASLSYIDELIGYCILMLKNKNHAQVTGEDLPTEEKKNSLGVEGSQEQDTGEQKIKNDIQITSDKVLKALKQYVFNNKKMNSSWVYYQPIPYEEFELINKYKASHQRVCDDRYSSLKKLFTSNSLTPSTVHDYGCNNGYFGFRLKHDFPSVKYLGLDREINLINFNKSLARYKKLKGFEFKQCNLDLNYFNQLKGSFDYALFFSIFHHLGDEKEMILDILSRRYLNVIFESLPEYDSIYLSAYFNKIKLISESTLKYGETEQTRGVYWCSN